METSYIQSRQNEQVKNLVKLRERKHRDRQSRFLIEGLREISHALTAGFAMKQLFFCPEFFPEGGYHRNFITESKRPPFGSITRLSEAAFEKASHREGPDGLIAVATQQNNALSDLRLASLRRDGEWVGVAREVAMELLDADPELEALSPPEKQLLRLGPQNAGRIKTTLRELRELMYSEGLLGS